MASRAQPTGSRMETCGDVCRRYITHAWRTYVRPDGTPTKTPVNIELALRPLLADYSDVTTRRFHSSHLRAIRAAWVDHGLTRTTINDRTRVIVGMFAWAAELGFATDDQVATLRAVRPLRRGMAQTLPHLTVHVADMIRFMLLTGCRVGEAREARSDELHRVEGSSLSLWVLRPRWHKTAKHGCSRSIVLNREAQRFVASRLGRTYLFGPRDGSKPYHGDALTTAIYRGCDRAGVVRWSPGQIRHTAATLVNDQFGLDAARRLLGHTTTRVTHRYIHSSDERATAEYVGALSVLVKPSQEAHDGTSSQARAG